VPPASAAAKEAAAPKDTAVLKSPKKETKTASAKAAAAPPAAKPSPVTATWRPKAEDKSVSPKAEDAKPASPKKEKAATAAPAAKEAGKAKQGAKQDGIMSLLESAFAKYETTPAPSAVPKKERTAAAPKAAAAPAAAAKGGGGRQSGEHEYSVAELLRLRFKTKRLRELPYRIVKAKTDGELLDAPERKPARRAEKPTEQQPVSRADVSAPTAAQKGSAKRDKLGSAAQPAAKKKPVEKASAPGRQPAASSGFMWKPKPA